MAKKKNGRVTPKGTQPAKKGGAKRGSVPVPGPENRAAPSGPADRGGQVANRAASAPFRHRAR